MDFEKVLFRNFYRLFLISSLLSKMTSKKLLAKSDFKGLIKKKQVMAIGYAHA